MYAIHLHHRNAAGRDNRVADDTALEQAGGTEEIKRKEVAGMYIDNNGEFVEKQGEVYEVEDGLTGRLVEDWYIRVSSYEGVIRMVYINHEPTEKDIFAALVKYGGELAEKIKMFSPEYEEK
jgi:hypothetical protein